MNLPTFGQVITADEVCSDVQDVLETGLPLFFAELTGAGGPRVDPPKKFEQVPDPAALKTDATPIVGIASPGWADPPHRDEDGSYSAVWTVNAIAYVRGGTYEETQAAGRLYAAAMRTVLAQCDLDCWLMDEGQEPVDGDAARTLAAAFVTVHVRVDGVVNETHSGPFGVPPYPVTTEVDVDVEREAV